MPRTRPLVIGHRGAPGYRPEHSRSSYDLALAMGVDAVEPDIVISSDGVLVVRHENEIGSTTDVGTRPEFADRRTTKTVDGVELTGWFTEDFTAAELTIAALPRAPAQGAGDERLLRRHPAGAAAPRRARPRARGLAGAGPRDRRRPRDQARHLLRRLRLGHGRPDRGGAAGGGLGRRRAAPDPRVVRVDGAAAAAGTRHPGHLHLSARRHREAGRPGRRPRRQGPDLRADREPGRAGWPRRHRSTASASPSG